MKEAGSAATLSEALDLWRGRAFDEFADEDFARAEAVRLEELRRLAIDERVEACVDRIERKTQSDCCSDLKKRGDALMLEELPEDELDERKRRHCRERQDRRGREHGAAVT